MTIASLRGYFGGVAAGDDRQVARLGTLGGDDFEDAPVANRDVALLREDRVEQIDGLLGGHALLADDVDRARDRSLLGDDEPGGGAQVVEHVVERRVLEVEPNAAWRGRHAGDCGGWRRRHARGRRGGDVRRGSGSSGRARRGRAAGQRALAERQGRGKVELREVHRVPWIVAGGQRVVVGQRALRGRGQRRQEQGRQQRQSGEEVARFHFCSWRRRSSMRRRISSCLLLEGEALGEAGTALGAPSGAAGAAAAPPPSGAAPGPAPGGAAMAAAPGAATGAELSKGTVWPTATVIGRPLRTTSTLAPGDLVDGRPGDLVVDGEHLVILRARAGEESELFPARRRRTCR